MVNNTMLKFITHRPLWINIITAIVLAIALFAIFILSLNLLTHHGRARTVPLVVGKTYDEGAQILSKGGFETVIQDSIYVDTLPPLTIIKQVPESDAVVKVNRTVYLTINRALPPMIDMPNLLGFSFRNAEMTLENMGLRRGDTMYKADFARNSVLEQLYKGEPIKPGTKIQMGSTIDLLLGSGVGETVFNVPELVGMTYGNAKARVEANGINLLVLSAPGVSDSFNAFIIRQEPKRFNEEGQALKIRSGQVISVILGIEKPVTDTVQNNPVDQ
jgi:beta-lactam-binding protein with PASTA domain